MAGPVVAAAVILDPDRPIAGLDDSKKLSERRRDSLFDIITSRATATSVAIVEPATIDRINILQATLEAMRRAVAVGPRRVGHAADAISEIKHPGLEQCPVGVVYAQLALNQRI